MKGIQKVADGEGHAARGVALQRAMGEDIPEPSFTRDLGETATISGLGALTGGAIGH